MAADNEEILDGLKTAMEAELTGYNFYKNSSENLSDPRGKETLARMADEEMEHFRYLRHQYKSVLEKGDYDFSRKLMKASKDQKENPVFSKEIKNRIKDCHFEVSVLTIGMKLELDAVNFYRSCAEKAQTDEARQIYQELADWELTHYEAFEWELEGLKEEYWHANNFVPMS
jgi:rubrerythrin